MATNKLTRMNERFPSVFDDFFKPWNEWFDSGLSPTTLTTPAVNITEDKDGYTVTMASPGYKKDDFHIDIEGNLLTISAENKEEKEEKDKKYTRKEYSYTSFSRSFTLPDEVDKQKIDAGYDKGILTLSLPKMQAAKEKNKQKIAVK